MNGVHFVMMWCAAVASWAWLHRTPFPRVRTGVFTCAGVLLSLLLWGQWRMSSAPTGEPGVLVSGLTPSRTMSRELQRGMNSISGLSLDDPKTARLLETAARLNADLLERSRAEARRGADVIVWSEHAARVTRQTEGTLIEAAQSVAESFGVELMLGIGLWDPGSRPAFENKVVAIDSSGRVSATYFKARPIAGRESGLLGENGDRIAVLDTAAGGSESRSVTTSTSRR